MGKKFVGLGGLKHFWTKAKTWIAGQITSEVTAKIAEIVANAPEDLDTLKEIADWISTHANDASAMNTQINTNKNDIAALQTSVAEKAAATHTHDDRYYTETEVDTKLSGKSDTGHTHTKSQITDFPTSLPANGGTADTANNGFNSSTVTDSTPGWGYLTSGNGYSNGRTYSFANGGGIATAEKDAKSSLQVDGDLYVHEGLDKVATLNAITNAINNLDVSSVGGDGKYISAISETNGKISATSTTMDTAPTTNSVKAVTSGGIKTAISTAETNAKNLANATGTLAVANGGTGVTTQADINKAFIGNLEVGNSDVTDGTEFVSSWASDNGFAETTEGALNKPYKRKFSKVWNYMKSKISSVLGLTKDNYGGKASTAGTADTATTAATLGRNGDAGQPMTFNWVGRDGQPYWLWGGDDGSNIYVYNPSNFSVNTATTATTAYKIRTSAPSSPASGDIWID